MATTPHSESDRQIDYPTSDGRPMGETETHINDLMDLLQTLRAHFAADPMVYVGGNMLLFYERGNRRKHISPDVFFVRGVEKRADTPRDYYLLWDEGKGPDVVIELTSRSTRFEDQKKKKALYRDVVRVAEYFLFDPKEDYLKPPMQGYRLVEGEYVPIELVEGRLPSVALGLHLEHAGTELRLYDPTTGRRLPTTHERAAEAEAERRRADDAERRAHAAEAEVERLRREIEALRRGPSGPS
ncbi:MAG: Uma2 family endonuclease [Planctomycetaceae bacterium]|nr:Uma2 family endonuclease [Planctomycetaceae bacterium]